jgi:Ras-related protein Rab-5C
MSAHSIDGKVVLLGSASVGKTAIVNRAVRDSFDLSQPSTVGAHYSAKTVVTEQGTAVLRIWDTAGQERYRALAPMYYQGSNIAIVVFSLCDPATLEGAMRWANELKEHFEKPPHIFLVGNKADLESARLVGSDEAMDRAAELRADYMETSAKTGQNIRDLFNAVADRIVMERFEHPCQSATESVVIEKYEQRSGGCKC